MEQKENIYLWVDPESGTLNDRPADGDGASAQPGSGSSGVDFDPVAVAMRQDGWTPEKQRAFIEELADCGVVREAAARVGMTEQSARRLRRRSDAEGFSRAWAAAHQLGIDRLHSLAYERAVNGTIRRHYFHGEVVGEDRVFDNRLLIYLLSRAANNRDIPAERVVENWDDWMGAVEDAVPDPMAAPDEDHRAPVWRAPDGRWMTRFPPPDGFDGEQWNQYGHDNYVRRLTADEEAAVEHWMALGHEEGRRRRDLYFARLK